jgi:hypothetical protein
VEAEVDPPLQNGKLAAPAVTEQADGVDTQTELAASDAPAPKAESSKIFYRIGVGAAAFVGLSLIVVFLFRPTSPSAAAPQVTPTAEAGREVAAPVVVATEQPPVQPSPTQVELAAQVTVEPTVAPATATQTPEPTQAPTVVPTATPLPDLPRVESIPHALAYTAGAPGNGDIYVMQAGKPNAVAVASAPCDEAEPDWSPDGKRLVFESNCNGSYDLADVAASGGKVRFLTSTQQYDELDPTYSPDGKTITFVRLLHGTALDAEGDLWSLNIDSGHSYALEVSGRAPVWSADSLKLAFMSQRSGKWNVYVHDFITGNDELVSFGCPTNCGWPEWSPDGNAIAYPATTADDSNEPETIFVWSPERRLPRVLVTGAVGRPSWSSAGLIAYGSGLGLEISDAENPARQLLLDETTARGPEWAQYEGKLGLRNAGMPC